MSEPRCGRCRQPYEGPEHECPEPNFDRTANEPDFVNDEGVKWWLVSRGVWLTELPNGEQNYVGILDGEFIADGQQLDAVGLKLDLIERARKLYRK